MKNTLTIFTSDKIKNFLLNFFTDYHIVFMKFDEIQNNFQNTQPNIILLFNEKDISLINFQNLNENYLVISNLKNKRLRFNKNIKLLNSPLSVNHFKSTIENFIQNLKIQFCDLLIDNEKLTNLKDNSFCYLTKIEMEILSYLLREKEASKNFIRENILNIKSNIETNSLESHLTRIRKKMNKINTAVKIRAKNERLIIAT